MSQHGWKLKTLLGCLMMVSILTACGGAPKAPENYEIAGTEVISFNTALGDDAGKLVSVEGLPEEEKDKDKDEDEDADASTSSEDTSADTSEQLPPEYIYTYEKLESGAVAAQTYVDTLLALDDPLWAVDDDDIKYELTDFAEEEGSVTLARNDVTEGKLLKLNIQWLAESCVITITNPDGVVLDEAPVEEAPQEAVEAMNVVAAVEFLRTISPTALGLDGDSMDDYNIYLADGEVRVDKVPAISLRVYRKAVEAGGNSFVGEYLIVGNRSSVYKVDHVNGGIVEVDF